MQFRTVPTNVQKHRIRRERGRKGETEREGGGEREEVRRERESERERERQTDRQTDR